MGREKLKKGWLWGASFGAVFFCFSFGQAFGGEVRITEIYPHPFSGEEEWIELKNFGSDEEDISGWIIKDAGNHKYTIPDGTIIGPEEIVVLERNFYLNNSGDEIVFLLDSAEIEIDGGDFNGENKHQGEAWSLLESGWNWSAPTKGEENYGEEDDEGDDEDDGGEEPEEEYSGKLRLNEILPNPSGDESAEEYIELYNYSDEEVDLEGWKLKDSSKTGEYIFSSGISLGSREYLAIYREDFAFALNNSNESVYFLDPDGEIASEVSFSGSAKEDVSYNFLEEKWRWSSMLTPGEANQLEKFPSFKMDLPEEVYKNAYAQFEVDIDDDEVGVRWDFGDKKTSTQRKVKHKYARLGKFSGSLTMTGKSETVQKEFGIEVERFENEDIELVALLPNPDGADMDGEWVEIRNNGKKEADLSGWSLATGSSNLYNHPINGKFTIKGGKSEKLFRDNCAFSLGNQEGKVELRYPDGETTDSVEYEKEKISEGEIYRKVGKKWVWEGGENIEIVEVVQNVEDVQNVESAQNVEDVQVVEGARNVESVEYDKLFTENPEGWENKKKYLLGEKMKLSDEVGEKIIFARRRVIQNSDSYSFNPLKHQKHWAVEWLSDFNYFLNRIF
ncbi:MAG: lamin tail domain-containing protein [Patescibacteria group bacterium]